MPRGRLHEHAMRVYHIKTAEIPQRAGRNERAAGFKYVDTLWRMPPQSGFQTSVTITLWIPFVPLWQQAESWSLKVGHILSLGTCSYVWVRGRDNSDRIEVVTQILAAGRG